ncbi:MAG: Excinuclease ABC C subunit domain protein [Candidatus Falkowbacteria bacterium GW2011_GWC2_38_22]|uniref:Excinuclease ABC C subunit domain protein n=1 Tax=Candidatus Falkowbacteria bacterium GW2011_GWE1_38_31 TaxID=1618638 RepID=A0A0G0JR02_9BACT|nr:MAG: Excinuclease ABC C subunit domain protein [Candidatus Falkowbacteria bacterium GW2011_GWF2_38_1205]KKQ61213.1 MAG: Excinuclease ABC C subunit domain protein [Candidatus Falkowbacteria bacterium GW2011_GWC2_38_22]KKQ63281.1 MAG: Excinuclease ABC C subunit domain protein [Candidatus Falkowbacteria bacterium GW2011_GWF1_38_22]KKQ65601.1 MAG: Excinuclease ABC C subunit domain protein [Candidatus Falkowbacteria bacterium GW2011_GWE2_38_254]KKQ70013.1 MAG: Excinuclease ABC C subunit domain pr
MNIKALNIPQTPGCYRYKSAKGEIIYIGKAVNLRSRVSSYWRESANHTPAKKAMLREIASVDWIETETEIEALLLEANLVKKFQPRFNIDLRDDKRFSYIKISTEDEIPGVFITRKIDKQGKYFGPFTSAGSVREVLKIIRKIWPYCTERTVKKKTCFYAQIGRCTGVCGGRFDVKEYKEKIIKPITLFLAGEKGKVIKKLEVRSKKLEVESKKLDARSKKLKEVKSYNTKNETRSTQQTISSLQNNVDIELRVIKSQLLNIKYVLASAKVIGVQDKYAADVVELAKILGLPRVPERIEGYDISNIFGKEAVGSMVVFSGGEPNKSEYKKFKIEVTSDMGDTGMLGEVMERRLCHIVNPSFCHSREGGNPRVNNIDVKKTKNVDIWLTPDLIIIDGGKGQLNEVIKILKKNNLDIPVLAISKGEGLRSAAAPDKIFFPGEKKPLELPLASPALHIIKRVRDEAHRFAIKFHRDLRKKRFLP